MSEFADIPFGVDPDFDDPTVTIDEFVARRDETQSEPLIACEQGTALPHAGLALLAGKSDDGKTTFTVDLSLHSAAGVDFCGLTFPRPLRWLLVENEGPREAFRDKLEQRLAYWPHPADGVRLWDEPARWGTVRASEEDVRARLLDAAAKHDTDIIVGDSLTRFGMRGNGTPEETREFVDFLTLAGLGLNLAYLLLHHPRTRAEQGESDLERLAGAWQPHADLILVLRRLESGRARLAFAKSRWLRAERPPSILTYDLEVQTFSYVGDDVHVERDLVAELTELMVKHDWWTTTDLRKRKEKGGVGADVKNVKKALLDGRFESALGEQIGRQPKSTYYRLRPSWGADDGGQNAANTVQTPSSGADDGPRSNVAPEAVQAPSSGADDGHDGTTLRPEGRAPSSVVASKGVTGDDGALGRDGWDGPLPGEDGFLDHVADAHADGSITTEQALEMEAEHKRVDRGRETTTKEER